MNDRKPVVRKTGLSKPKDFDLRPLSRDIAKLLERIEALGNVAIEGMGMRESLGVFGAGGSAGLGVKVTFGEGNWSFGAAGFPIDVGPIWLCGMGRRTIFKRTVASTAPLLYVTGASVKISDIYFDDAIGTEPTIEMAGRAVLGGVYDCYFNSYRAIDVTARMKLVIARNMFETYDTAKAINLTGASKWLIVSQNMFNACGTDAIYAGDNVESCSFTGNVAVAATNVLNYKAGLSNVEAGNVGTVNVR